MFMTTITSQLIDISYKRRRLWKILGSKVEGYFGALLFRRSPTSQKRLLNLGCGITRFKEFINADFYRFTDIIRRKSNLPDWMLNAGKNWKCSDNFWEGIYTEHTLEHLDYSEVIVCLKECFRTLQSGAWLRVVLPGLEAALQSNPLPFNAMAVGSLTQTHGHISVWDGDLLCALLREIGFTEVNEVAFKEGRDQRLLVDLEERKFGSFYVEAMKPVNK
jgi:hypothetical protein